MPTLTQVFIGIIIWFLLAILLAAMYNATKYLFIYLEDRKDAVPQTLIQRFHDDTLIINFYIFGEDPEPTERIFSVDSSGETICSQDGAILATAYLVDEDPVEFYVYPSITVDDSESHDMFRNNAGVNLI